MEHTTDVQAGDHIEWNAVLGPYLPRLKQFAERHLPAEVRGAIGADDLVQDVVMKGWRQVHRFERQREGALLAYLLTSIRHRIVDEIRKMRRRPLVVSLGDREHIDPATSPLERLITREDVQHLAAALARLNRRDRRLIELRMHRRLSYSDVAVRMGMDTNDAVRMAVRRALQRLAEAAMSLEDGRDSDSVSEPAEQSRRIAAPPRLSSRSQSAATSNPRSTSGHRLRFACGRRTRSRADARARGTRVRSHIDQA